MLSEYGALSLASQSDLSTAITLPTSSKKPVSQKLGLRPLNRKSPLLPPSLLGLVPQSARAHLAIITRSYGAGEASNASSVSLLEAGKKKFKKSKRPSSAAVIDEADAAGASAGADQSEIELVLLDPAVEKDGETGPALVSLGKVELEGSQAAIMDEGILSCIRGSIFSAASQNSC